MPGGLMQLTAFGAQNVLINGNPSMSYFTKLYKRTTSFAMEHFRLEPRNITDTTLPIAGNATYRFKVPNYADLLHDCYFCVNLPDIWSPIAPVTPGSTVGYPYEFRWSENVGFNMIEEVSINFNGSTIVTMTGEWMKILSYLREDVGKREVIDEMVGNVKELNDPANANGRINQYPQAIANQFNTTPAPSIRGRTLQIPLPFWFCKEISQSLPLIAMRLTEIEFVITLTNIYQLYTLYDVSTPPYNYRILPIPGSPTSGIQNFLSYPDINGFPTNSSLTNWNLDPYIEANYIFLTDTERAYVAANERTFLITQVKYVYNEKQYGLNSALIPMYNLCTRVVALFQRYDRTLINDWDNYTNWENQFYPPIIAGTPETPAYFQNTIQPEGVYSPTQFLSSGTGFLNNMIQQDILVEGNLVFDGKDRFSTKNADFFRSIQNYQFSKGDTERMPGIYLYSFALDPDTITQPSGTVNASMFNKTYFNYNLLVPPVIATALTTQASLCVLRDSVFSTNPGPGINVASTISPGPGIPPSVSPADVVTLYSAPTNLDLQYQGYNSTVYIESYNFLKVTNGQANIAFTT